MRGKPCSLVFGQYFAKYTFLTLWRFFLAYWLSNQLNFSVAVRICKFHDFDEAFLLLTIGTPMVTKLLCGNMLRRALTHKYTWTLNGVALRGDVTYKILISTCRIYITTTLGKVLAQCSRLSKCKSLWSSDKREVTWLFKKSLCSTFTWFILNKRSRLLTLGRIFSAQTNNLVSI